MERTIWGWFDAAPVAVTDPATGEVHPIRITASEAEALGVPKRRMIVYDSAGFLEVVPAPTAGPVALDPADHCVHFLAPGSTDWILIRRRDGARARIRRGETAS